MAKFVIRVDPFDPASVRRANMSYQQRIDEFNRKVDYFLQRISEIGAEEAQAVYGHAVSVNAVPVGKNEWAIQADGKAVVFLEFGAGDTVNTGNRYAGAVTAQGAEIRSKSWSEQHAHQYEKLHKWEFPPGSGNWMTAVAPRNAMEKAYEKIVESIPTVTEEVFK